VAAVAKAMAVGEVRAAAAVAAEKVVA